MSVSWFNRFTYVCRLRFYSSDLIKVVTISSMFKVLDPDCSRIDSKASSIIRAFRMYLSRRCFFSLLVAIILCKRSFRMAMGFANSCLRPPPPPCSLAPLAAACDWLKVLSSNSMGSSLSLRRSYSFLISNSNFSFSSSCLALSASI